MFFIWTALAKKAFKMEAGLDETVKTPNKSHLKFDIEHYYAETTHSKIKESLSTLTCTKINLEFTMM